MWHKFKDYKVKKDKYVKYKDNIKTKMSSTSWLDGWDPQALSYKGYTL